MTSTTFDGGLLSPYLEGLKVTKPAPIPAGKPYLTDTQFRHYKRLAALMDSGKITPEECAVRAVAHGLPWRSLRSLTGLSDGLIDAALQAAGHTA